MELTNKQFLSLAKMFHQKWAELICKEIDKDIEKIEQLDALDSYYLRAYWHKRGDALVSIDDLVKRTDDIDERFKTVMEVFSPDSIETIAILKENIAARLEWFKEKIATDFEKKVLSKIDWHSITSPIEQLFLMEWEYIGPCNQFSIELLPQAEIQTDSGKYFVDFLISDIASQQQALKVAIELDGHDFHEKSKKQVQADKRRERALVRSDITVLRFSGSEVVRNSRKCVLEVISYLAKKMNNEKPTT